VGKFIHIRSTKFPILPDEEEELVNAGTYGKALSLHLQAELVNRGYESPFVCCEDWGWWVELRGAPFAFGVCVYSRQVENEPIEFACTDGAAGRRTWSWKRLRFVDTTQWSTRLHEDLMAIFQADEEVNVVNVSEDFPL
jgi:hypothetical protein